MRAKDSNGSVSALLVPKHHLDGISAVNNVEVGDDIPLLTPEKPRAGPLWDFEDIERKEIAPQRRVAGRMAGTPVSGSECGSAPQVMLMGSCERVS